MLQFPPLQSIKTFENFYFSSIKIRSHCDISLNYDTNQIKNIVQVESQKQIFIRIINGNQGIVKSLCKAYYASYEDQRDAYQDIILQLWKSFNTFRGESELSTWIYKVGLNTLLAKVRKERSRISTEPLLLVDPNTTWALADDDTELLSLVMQSLKDIDKAIVILYLEGYKNKEIAQMLEISPTNVSSRLNRVKTALKVKFKNYRYEFE